MIRRSLIRAGLRRCGAALLLFVSVPALGAPADLRIAEIRIEGDSPFREARAKRRWVGLHVGDPFDPAAAQAAADRLMNACRARQYPLARVHWEASPVEESGSALRLRFHVETGQKGRVHEVRFEGNKVLESADLAPVLRVRPRGRIRRRLLGRLPLRMEHLAEDRQALLRRYQQDGRMAADIGDPRVEWLEAEGKFRVTWPVVQEGPVYRMGNLYVQGDDTLPVAALADRLGLRRGDILRPDRLQGVGERIRVLYQAHGHAFASVTVEPVWRDEEAALDVWIKIFPGERQHLRTVHITGNVRSHETILRREIPLHPGARFDPVALVIAQKNLEALGLFSAVEIEYHGGQDSPVFDLSVNVREKRTGRMETGFEYGTAEGGAFLLRVSERNLALRPPFRGRALQGELGATVGSEILRLDAGLQNPRLGYGPWGLGVYGSYEDNAYISEWYDQRSLGAQVQTGRSVGKYHRFSLGFGWTRYEVTYADPEILGPPPGMKPDMDLTALLGSWMTEKADHPFRPTRGFRVLGDVRLGSVWLGGDTDAVEFDIRAEGFLNPLWAHVLALSGGIGSVAPYGDTETAPLPLRRHLGGTENLRGFAYRTVSPLNEQGVPTGGQSDWWATVEYILPVLSRLDVSAYVDMGDVGPDAFGFVGDGPVANWGVGLVIRADNFPVRLDLAFPIRTIEGDRVNRRGEARFSFSANARRF